MEAPKLVILDDDTAFARHVAEVAADVGFDATVEPNAAEFMEHYDNAPPAVIVMELVLLDQDGLGLMRWLFERGATAHLIVITAYSRSYARAAEMLVEARGGMSIAIHTKPIEEDVLRGALESAMSNLEVGCD